MHGKHREGTEGNAALTESTKVERKKAKKVEVKSNFLCVLWDEGLEPTPAVV